MPELDSLRGVAILAVVFYHGLFWSNNLQGLSGAARIAVNLTRFGWLGVNLFFVLSGFLITGILLGLKPATNYYSHFYFRRAVRILPALYVLLFLLCFIPHQNYKYLLLSFFSCANLAPLLHIASTYPVLWSLAVEEHFYLLWPWAVRRLGKRWLYFLIAILFLGAPIMRGMVFARPLPEGFGTFSWQVCDGIASGALLALLIREPWMNRRVLVWISCSSLALACLGLGAGAPFGVLTRNEPAGAIFMLSLINFTFVGLVGIAIWCASGPHATVVEWKILNFYGNISYGLYLYHLLAFMLFDWAWSAFWPRGTTSLGVAPVLFLRFGVALALATGAAYFSRWYFEEIFLKMKLRPRKTIGLQN